MAHSFAVEPKQSVEVWIGNADGHAGSTWSGELAFTNEAQVSQEVLLSYANKPDGAWVGEIYYFGNFQLNDSGLKAWLDNDHALEYEQGIQNAFLQMWAKFRRNPLAVDKFVAVLVSTRDETWRSQRMVECCAGGGICYPYLNADGCDVYTRDPNAEPVPSGVVELPFAMNIKASDDATTYHGRIDSARALQYPGDPAVSLQFDTDPTGCSVDTGATCLVFLEPRDDPATPEAHEVPMATVAIGGRIFDRDCQDLGAAWQPVALPWLLPGFSGRSSFVADLGQAYTHECRQGSIPFDPGLSGQGDINLSIAGANPTADGKERRRTLELIDGALINSEHLFVLFRERVLSLVDDKDTTAYGFMWLQRDTRALHHEDFVGSEPPSPSEAPPVEPLACSAELLEEVDFALGTSASWAEKARYLLDGTMTLPESQVIYPNVVSPPEDVYYLCESEEGSFFGPRLEPGSCDEDTTDCPPEHKSCSPDSRVTYFTLCAGQALDVSEHPCNDGEQPNCHVTLHRWVQNQRYVCQLDPAWRCGDYDPEAGETFSEQVYCSNNLQDLRHGKIFYAKPENLPAALTSMTAAIDDAFRYRTRFQTRSGGAIGFVPEICIPGSEAVPYCYDPGAIEDIATRMDCLVDIYVNRYQEAPEEFGGLHQFLKKSFAYEGVTDEALNITTHHSGFEKLYAELIIMLGDHSYTTALSSRFDLAATQSRAFAGSALEPNGIDLAGVAGAEMFNLYRASQYYQQPLHRFFALLPHIQRSVSELGPASFVGQATVVEYFGRLIRASTQKARVASEISKRYQGLNRPDLARLVIERGYTAAYIESMILTGIMQELVAESPPEKKAQIVRSIQQSQVSYRVALTEMRTQYDAIQNGLDMFGLAPDYMPFPATEAQVARDNAFEVMVNRAWQRLQIAQQAEDTALQTERSFDTDAASFQNELVRVENNYEGQLADLCGTFVANGRVYPAIRKYAYLLEEAELMGDPCGRMGTGQIHNAIGNTELELVDAKRVRRSIANAQARIEHERARIDRVCNTVSTYKNYFLNTRNEQISLDAKVRGMTLASQKVEEILGIFATSLQLGGSPNPIAGAAGTAAYLKAAACAAAARFSLDTASAALQTQIAELQRDEATISYDMQCNTNDGGINQIESEFRIKDLFLEVSVLRLDALRAHYELAQAAAQVQQLQQQARRISSEMQEMIQLTINLEAARNDPNIRIYRNDAIINADKMFASAVREAYRATRVYEYYTSQSYARLDQLFLVRMVTRGDYNLQNYLVELEDAFRSFEDTYGLPDMRVTRLSLRDDILQIPRLKVTGEPMVESERVALFRQRLQDPSLFDKHGYIAIAFHTALRDLSPLTRNHKLKYIEASIVGSDFDDQSARVYLRMLGTSAIAPVDGELTYYTFPQRTAVINAFFGGDKSHFAPEVYRSSRFIDRPYLNSRWELVLNLVDEQANQDIRVRSLNDIRLYLYYSDFTVF